MQPYLLPNTLDCLRRAIGLAGAYRLTGAGCKKDFNKGVLPVAHIWSHIKEGDGVKHQDLEVISQFGEGEKFRIASKLSSELRIRYGPWLKPWPRTTPLHTNLAADVAKLSVWCCARTGGGGTPKLVQAGYAPL